MLSWTLPLFINNSWLRLSFIAITPAYAIDTPLITLIFHYAISWLFISFSLISFSLITFSGWLRCCHYYFHTCHYYCHCLFSIFYITPSLADIIYAIDDIRHFIIFI
jgi:hypothetical protein